jgi:hypothetical protein
MKHLHSIQKIAWDFLIKQKRERKFFLIFPVSCSYSLLLNQ